MKTKTLQLQVLQGFAALSGIYFLPAGAPFETLAAFFI